MGVPGFVAWLRDYFKDKMIQTKLPYRPKKLYIDGNCLIHPKCFEVLAYMSKNDNNDINIDKLETIMFNRITKYINYLTNYVNPEVCYFTVDGVAPAAKINQQRFRRYKSVVDNELKAKLKEKYKINTDKEIKWSNTVITPGTEFMNKLNKHLQNYFNNLNKTNQNSKFVYSSYLEAGEGEHKIMDDIRNSTNESTINDIYVIYGLDADLFFLSMSSQKKNIYLLREEQHFVNGQQSKTELFDVIDDVAEDLRYVSIDITKQCYDIRMQHIVKNKLENSEDFDHNRYKTLLERTEYCSDFVFLCYLLGNDFLPHLPTIDIKKNGLDTLIDCYVDTYINLSTKLILSNSNDLNITINVVFLTELLRCLGELEERFYKEIVPKYEHRMSRRTCPSTDEYSRELWNIENMRYSSFIQMDDDPIKCGTGDKDVWKWKYYEYYYGTTEKDSQKNFVNLMCKMYIEGLIWVTKYYYQGCPSWKWKFPFIHAPFISDIYTYLNETNMNINDIKFNLTKSLTPEQQLLAVLPYSCNNLVSKKYRYLMTDKTSPIKDMYPSEVKIDMIHKDMYWMCIPMLPYLDIDRIIDATNNIQ